MLKELQVITPKENSQPTVVFVNYDVTCTDDQTSQT